MVPLSLHICMPTVTIQTYRKQYTKAQMYPDGKNIKQLIRNQTVMQINILLVTYRVFLEHNRTGR